MKHLWILLFLVAACEYDEASLGTEPGLYACVSSQGRKEYRFDSKTLHMSRVGLNVFVVRFAEIGTGTIIRLHSVDDRDYNCGPVKA